MPHHSRHHHDPEDLVERSIARLRAAGERITPARRDMLAVLAGTPDHLSADDVAARLAASQQTGRAHRTTVYRTLERFAELGVVLHRRLAGGAAGYHLMTEGHLHGECSSCGTVVALPGDFLDDLAPARERLRASSGFDVDLRRSTLAGLCATCRSA